MSPSRESSSGQVGMGRHRRRLRHQKGEGPFPTRLWATVFGGASFLFFLFFVLTVDEFGRSPLSIALWVTGIAAAGSGLIWVFNGWKWPRSFWWDEGSLTNYPPNPLLQLWLMLGLASGTVLGITIRSLIA